MVAHSGGASREALRQSLASLLPDLRAYAKFLTAGSGGADDLVHDALVRALAGLDGFAPATSLRAWSFTILRNLFYEQARRRRRERAALAAQAVGAEGLSAPHGAELGEIQTALFTLTPILREAIALVGIQQLSCEEAAAICGVPAGTMRARVSRGRALLAERLARPPGST